MWTSYSYQQTVTYVIINSTYKIHNNNIKKVSSTKYLGVTINGVIFLGQTILQVSVTKPDPPLHSCKGIWNNVLVH